MSQRSGSYPRVRVSGDGAATVSQAGGVLLVEAIREGGLDWAISAALEPWRRPRAVHDPARCCWISRWRWRWAVTACRIWRCCGLSLGCSGGWPPIPPFPGWWTPWPCGSRALTAIRRARAAVRERVWKLAGTNASGAGGQVIVDIDGVLILAHSEPQLVQGLCAAECLAQQVWHSGLLSGRPITRYVLPQPAQGLVHDRVTSDLACPVGWVGRMSLCPSLIRKSSARMSYGSRGTAARA